MIIPLEPCLCPTDECTSDILSLLTIFGLRQLVSNCICLLFAAEQMYSGFIRACWTNNCLLETPRLNQTGNVLQKRNQELKEAKKLRRAAELIHH